MYASLVRSSRGSPPIRPAVVALLGLSALLLGHAAANAAEIIPRVGITRPAEGDDAKVFGGVALRGPIVPRVLHSEIAVDYRSEERLDGSLDVRQWPITGSLWITPVPSLYAGGGVGWYHTTFDYDASLPFDDETKQEFGAHVGGGLRVPLAPRVGLDLNGRYVFMREQESEAIPERFDPDFWQTSVGLAIGF